MYVRVLGRFHSEHPPKPNMIFYRCTTLGHFGELLLEMNELKTAGDRLEEAIAIAQASRLKEVEGYFLGALGEVRAREGNVELGRSLFARADTLFGSNGRQINRGEMFCRRGQIERLAGNHTEAKRALSQAKAVADEMNLGPSSALHHQINVLETSLN